MGSATRQGKAWILGIQMEIQTRDYRSADAFEAALERAIAQAAQDFPDVFREEDTPRLLVLPECLGAFLLFTVEPLEECFAAPDVVTAYQALVRGLVARYGSDWEALGRLLGPGRRSLWPGLKRDLLEVLAELAGLQKKEDGYRKALDEWRAELQSLPGTMEPGPEAEARQTDLERDVARQEALIASLHGEATLLGMELIRVLFALYADRIVDVYHGVFSRLARKSKSWIVAGSLYGPWMEAKDGRPRLVTRKVPQERFYQEYMARLVLRPLRGPDLYSLSPLYDASGALVHVFPKCFPTREEIETVGCVGVSPSLWKALPTEPFGKLGTIICADSWYPAMYDLVNRQKVQVVAVPSFGNDRDSWDRPWNGYSGTGHIPVWDESVVKDVVAQAAITGGGAWVCFALTHQMPAKARYDRLRGASDGRRLLPEVGVNVFACGRLWGSRAGGRSVAVWFEEPDDRSVEVESSYAPYVDEPAHIAVQLVDGQVQTGSARPRFRLNARGAWEGETPPLDRLLPWG